jgi:hypothetical protein
LQKASWLVDFPERAVDESRGSRRSPPAGDARRLRQSPRPRARAPPRAASPSGAARRKRAMLARDAQRAFDCRRPPGPECSTQSVAPRCSA